MPRLSRRQVADYVADQILAGNATAIKQLAAYLVATKQTTNVELFVRDIEYSLSQKGHVVADVTSAFELTATTKRELEQFVKQSSDARSVEFRETVDDAVLGGVRLQFSERELDTTLARQLTTLRTQYKKA